MTSERRYRAVAHTIEVVVAAATVKEELRLDGLVERQYEFRLLAAAAREVPELPESGWHDLQRQIKVHAVAVGEELQLSLQAHGYAALHQVAGRGARLTSSDGVLDVRFRFDPSGNAFTALQASEAVYRALAHFHLIMDKDAV